MASPSYAVPDQPPNDLAGFEQLNITADAAGKAHCSTDPLPDWIAWDTKLWNMVAKGTSDWACIEGETLVITTAEVVMRYHRPRPLIHHSYGTSYYVLRLTGYDIPGGPDGT